MSERIDKYTIVTKSFLDKNPNIIFVFGDNTKRFGKRGAAILRDHKRAYGFITKKYPSNEDRSFFRPNEYSSVFEKELELLTNQIKKNPNFIYLISKLGSGLANKYRIWEKVIEPGILCLKEYPNVKFLF